MVRIAKKGLSQSGSTEKCDMREKFSDVGECERRGAKRRTVVVVDERIMDRNGMECSINRFIFYVHIYCVMFPQTLMCVGDALGPSPMLAEG